MKEVTAKEAFSALKPESCIFVISVDEEGEPGGMISGCAMKCSYAPPMFAIAVSKGEHTRKLISHSKEFVVAVPNRSLEEAVKIFASTCGDEIDKFAESEIATEEASKVKPPLLKDATINFECRLDQEIDTGDHITFIGKVLCSWLKEGGKVLMNMEMIGEERIFGEF